MNKQHPDNTVLVRVLIEFEIYQMILDSGVQEPKDRK